jgi:bacterial/archaeal transporter family-2 protein
MQNWILLIVAVIIGTIMPMQAAINSKLANHVQSPILAALVSFLVGTVTLILYILFSGVPLSNLAQAKNAPSIAWAGGFIGAIFVAVVAYMTPRLGVALLFSLIILGQMIVTLLIDHYGFLGIPIKEISFPRILGILLVIAGVIVIRRF